MYGGNRKSSGYRENPSHPLKRVYAQYDDVKVLSELFLSLAFSFFLLSALFPFLGFVLVFPSLPFYILCCLVSSKFTFIPACL